MLSTSGYKGTRDFFPTDFTRLDHIKRVWRASCHSFGYEEYDGPMLEEYSLYAAKSGEELVSEQLYSFHDRGKRHLAIRPEMTPTMARMVASRHAQLPKPIRWFSIPNVYRYERPQRGRLREHWQLNVDLLGAEGVWADFEMVTLALSVLENFGAKPGELKLRLNSRTFINYYFHHVLGLNPEDSVRLMKLLDRHGKMEADVFAKNLSEIPVKDHDALKKVLEGKTESFLEHESLSQLRELLEALKKAGYGSVVEFDPLLMRGLDYYTGIVFEIFDTHPENRRAIAGGGRYDDLVGMFGNSKISGIGFGMGDVTLGDFLEVRKLIPEQGAVADVFLGALPDCPVAEIHRIAAELRKLGLRVVTALEAGKVGKYIQAASARKINFVGLVGATELAQGAVSVKNLTSGDQVLLKPAQLPTHIRSSL